MINLLKSDSQLIMTKFFDNVWKRYNFVSNLGEYFIDYTTFTTMFPDLVDSKNSIVTQRFDASEPVDLDDDKDNSNDETLVSEQEPVIAEAKKLMALKVGIVGLPNIGKSTLFNAITNASAEVQNYPFCTIEPNSGIVPIPDTRLQTLSEISNSKNVLPATIEFFDIAGLVKGSKGEGLGNKFLANIRETSAIVHMVRCFENDNIIHVNGKVNPLDDIETINTELLLSDLELAEKLCDNQSKKIKTNKAEELKNTLFNHIKEQLALGKFVRQISLTDEDKQFLQGIHF